MNSFDSIQGLLAAVDKSQLYTHQIKGKRVRKQIQGLTQTHFQGIKYNKFQIGPLGISIYVHKQQLKVDVKCPNKDQLVTLKIRLDSEYPFNPPQIHYVPAQKQKTQYGYCKDLLPNILKEHPWGPSLTLTYFMQKLQELGGKIQKKGELQWKYHCTFEYGKEELTKSNVKLFKIQQYRWDFKILKSKRDKILGLTADCLLILQQQRPNKQILKLQKWANLHSITQIQAKLGKKYQLQIKLTPQSQVSYLGGEESDLQAILDCINPIQMIQRKVKGYGKSGISDYEDAIQSYSTLVQYYSLSNKELTDKYMRDMKKAIHQHYKLGEEGEEKETEKGDVQNAS